MSATTLARQLIKLEKRFSSRHFSLGKKSNMRYVQYKSKNGGKQHLGAQISIGGDIVDISSVDSSIPNNLVDFLKLGSPTYEKARRIIADSKSVTPLSDAILLPPITNGDKVVCVGLNYKGHCDEQNTPYPKEPMFFSKFSSVIVGPNDNVVIPPITNQVDWETELAVVIGRQGKALRQDQVQDYIFGYTVAQDISARDWQKTRNNGQFLLGKSMDTFCPLGPAVVTKSKVNVNDLTVKTWVNGKLKQNGNTAELIFTVDFLVSYLSQIMTLYPGDVILTGTPAGVGVHRNPPEFLQPGDVLESEIAGIGRLRNVVTS
ncbi:fumarylacetoacetate hydrolase domain-containing protein 2 isoform X3 [Anthonomus grandis grandis]|uniref:fumarylacetoacetate hydrolase domain-containing protein 2 isoform X1 n=1 Tax=Anthonomus grandis grandis TaxID=2921223 RepID=UPI002165B8B8|nr:fumarylacetoacetate hydrolase domain-containing protein 2 isoform X1 [Anthonomus grandis grandis]XP_050310667.1 fumarylacetoacetate hydrolase domain-containing protein 2 isoform X2 [Anthonomus grandis grandis]XP_050310669.1 fumarylacetoacetate hydrolase domain-containing protein 2 isoform X3 [Anthonomus grandis grandis]